MDCPLAEPAMQVMASKGEYDPRSVFDPPALA
jgi:hypothetical protein